MYDLDGSDIDWVEVYNPDSVDVDITILKLLISNSTSNHGIVKYSGSQVLHSGEYGIITITSQISLFTAKWSGVANIFTSSFSLPNDTAKVEINNGDKNIPLSSVTYNSSQGATEDGKSLQLIGGLWIAVTPTPGVLNQAPASGSNSSDASTNTPPVGSGASGGSSSGSSIKKAEEPKIKVKIMAKTLAFPGTPFSLQGLAYGYDGTQLYYGKYFWNFGDGASMEAENNMGFLHTYFYPGEYFVSLEYSTNIYSSVPDAVEKIVIKVVPMTVSISRVGDASDFFIELSNNKDYEIDISKWILSSLRRTFVLPKNTVILAKNKIMLSPQITHFTFGDAASLKLSTAFGQAVFDYGLSLVSASVVPIKIADKTTVPPKSPSVKSLEENIVMPISDGQILVENLSASVAESDVLKNSDNNSYLPMLIYLISFVFVGGSAGAVYFIRQKKTISVPGDDFKILDE